jgi:sigma-B regulation protein RsbU (phosphoserine phosphatase)
MQYSNAGHNPPIVADDTRRDDVRLDCGGPVLGVFSDSRYDEATIALRPSARILMYTDGITECRNLQGDEFGEPRLADLVCFSEHASAAPLTDAVIHAATEFSHGHFEDDLTVVAVTVE